MDWPEEMPRRLTQGQASLDLVITQTSTQAGRLLVKTLQSLITHPGVT